ncbi:MAG TPA: response regulator [Thermomicrobiales bacterium]|nr:response regulator [Thermomicrobiales bacterium]
MGSPTLTRVLIADDESIIRLNLREMLTQQGYEVIAEASNGRQAVDLARKLQPDLAIVDIKMPEMDGLEAAEAIVSADIAPVILLTAYSDDELIASARKAGVSGYLVKPLRETELAPVVEIALARFEDLRSLRQRVLDLEDALETRKLVERAKGVLMDVHGLSESDAFRRMRKTSMDNRKSMREVAEAILLSHDLQLNNGLS